MKHDYDGLNKPLGKSSEKKRLYPPSFSVRSKHLDHFHRANTNKFYRFSG